MSYLAIVGTNDQPLYELSLLPSAQQGGQQGAQQSQQESHLYQFIAYAALDHLQALATSSNQTYLKVIDKFNEFYISAFLCPSGTHSSLGLLLFFFFKKKTTDFKLTLCKGTRLVLLHTTQNTDGIRNLFQELHELFLKVLLNPLWTLNSPILSPQFDQKVRVLAKKWI
jgi:hypothetical protein